MMDYNTIKNDYSFKINEYVARISRTMDVSATTYGGNTKTTTGMVKPSIETEMVISDCINNFMNILSIRYPNVSKYEINEITNRIFTNEVIPKLKKVNEKNMRSEMTKSYWSEGLSEVLSFMIFGGIVIFILYILGILK